MSNMSTIFQAWDTPEGITKMASVSTDFIQDKLRENSVWRQILPAQKVTRDTKGMQVSTKHDTLEFIAEMAPNSRAMPLTFRGQPNSTYIQGNRYAIPFDEIGTEIYEKNENELMAYRMNIQGYIEDNLVRDMQEVEDWRGVAHSEAATAATGYVVRGQQATADAEINGAGTGFRGKLQKQDLVQLIGQIDGRRSALKKFLMTNLDANDVMLWTIEDLGGDKVGEVTAKGFTSGELVGRQIVRTIKTDVLKPGNIYGYAAANELGHFLVLQEPKFYFKRDAKTISMRAWETVASSIGHIARVAKLELYNGQGGGDDSADALLPEREIGTTIYNRVADGLTFPSIASI